MPDYGEPWFTDGIVYNRIGDYAEFCDDGMAIRAVSCVNACAGIEDPESRIGKLIESELNLDQLVAAVIEIDPSSKYLDLAVKHVQKLARELKPKTGE